MEKAAAGTKKVEWLAEETLYLMDLWEENIDGLRGVRKNTHIYKEIGEKLSMTGAEVKNKIDNLTKKNRKEQAKIGPSGGEPSTWEHYDRLHKILATSKAINYKRLMVESSDLTPLHSCNDVDVSTESSAEASTSHGKKRRTDKLDRLLEIEENKLSVLTEMSQDVKLLSERVRQSLDRNNNQF